MESSDNFERIIEDQNLKIDFYEVKMNSIFDLNSTKEIDKSLV